MGGAAERALSRRKRILPGLPPWALALSVALHGGLLAGLVFVGTGRGPPPAFAVTLQVLPEEETAALEPEPREEPPLPREEAPPVERCDPPDPPEPAPADFAGAPCPDPVVEPEVEAPDPVPPRAWLVRLTRRKPEPEPPPVPAPRPSVPIPRAEPTPVPGTNEPPHYPPLAVRRRLEGRVVVEVEVDATGAVSSCRVVRSSGHRLLDDAALAAVRRWRFAHGPGLLRVPIEFHLRRRKP